MTSQTISPGNILQCASCGHERTVTEHWYSEIAKRHFPKRTPFQLYFSDLSRFKCSSCGEKALRGEIAKLPLQLERESEEGIGRQLAATVIAEATPLEREDLLRWAKQLIAIRDSDLPVSEKVKKAISATLDSKAIMPFIKTIGREIKRLGWDERSLPARIGLGAAALALLIPGKGAAGLAAFGGAIGVPLWIVFGAGGAFAGVLIEEINRQTSVFEPSKKNLEPRDIEGEVLERKINDAKRRDG